MMFTCVNLYTAYVQKYVPSPKHTKMHKCMDADIDEYISM